MKQFSSLISIFFFSSLLFSQTINSKIDSILKKIHLANPSIALSVGIIQKGQKSYYNYGTISRSSSENVNERSVFEIASITKILTTNLIAQAEIEGKLSVDDFIDLYLPKNYQLKPALRNKVRISDLASHQSGLPDINFSSLIQLNPQNPMESIDQSTLNTLLNTADNLLDYGVYRYSTVGYVLLGQVLEFVYQKTYDEIVQDKLILPLKLKTTLTTDFDVPNKVTGYNAEGGIQDLFLWNFMAPAGMIKSSAEDMLIYLEAVLDSLHSISKAAQLTEQTFYSKNDRELGLGINIMKQEKSTLYGKSGDSMGQSSMIAYNRATNSGCLLLINERNSKLRQQLLAELSELIF